MPPNASDSSQRAFLGRRRAGFSPRGTSVPHVAAVTAAGAGKPRGFGPDPFSEPGVPRRLSVYDGLPGVNGQGVNACVAAWPVPDMMAMQVEDERIRVTPV